MDETEVQYSTASHENDLDTIFDERSASFDEEIYENQGFKHDLQAFLRFVRKKVKSLFREKAQENFTNILYLTLDCPPFTPNSSRLDNPFEYITSFCKQYPYNDIRVLIPIIGLKELKSSKKINLEVNENTYTIEKTSLSFSFFLQNKRQEGIIYKFPKNISNVQVYGIYCEGFSEVNNVSEMSKITNLAPFMKASRMAVRNFAKLGFSPDIVHSEHLPYYLGGEFELQIPQGVKILQSIKDFAQIDMTKPELFWAAINLADENAMSKICKDSVIKKHIARLFNLQQTKKFTRMSECLNSVYDNYYRFRKYVEQGEDLDENAIFNRLNMRISEMFPQLADGELYYNQMAYSLKHADFWAVNSKTYYKEIFENPQITGKLHSLVKKYKDKSNYLYYGTNMPDEDRQGVYYSFNKDNFRENRAKNKKVFLKEFNAERIKTNFIDSSLFKNDNHEIIGNLDSFYEAPLLFANPSSDIFANGIDILFNSILKLFELHKNIQVVICIKDGLKNNFIKSWVNFLSGNRSLNGRWVFIDGDINTDKFLASSDIILFPRRVNISSPEHFWAMYYGCVPVVSRSGILNDTIVDIFDDITLGCGFKTKKSLITEEDNTEIFLTPLVKALNIYQNNPSSWNLLIKNCMNHDSGWSFKILEKYNKIYQELL